MTQTIETTQSTLTFIEDEVVKVYKKDHPFFDRKYFKSEMHCLEKLLGNEYIVGGYNPGDCQYTMKRYDFSLGTASQLSYPALSRVLFSLSLSEIFENLDEITAILITKGIRHRDINPGNLLYSERERELKLTDFFWATDVDNYVALPNPNKKHPWPVNGVYGNSDHHAIDMIKAGIYDFYYNTFVPTCDEIIKEFVSTIGRGKYKDGSSIFFGYSYHVVDIPRFEEIKFHKNVCIDEYNVIKNTLPIKPRSFADIGAAAGYFSFNLIRDFDIKTAIAFEADPAAQNLLRQSVDLYGLDSLYVSRRDFTHKTQLSYTDFDVVIWLNSHMWIYKQEGKERALECVRTVLKNCRYMYFQTCGAYSSGMYKVMEYLSPKDIVNMLYEAGAVCVDLVHEFIGSHDAPRHMFLVKGGLK